MFWFEMFGADLYDLWTRNEQLNIDRTLRAVRCSYSGPDPSANGALYVESQRIPYRQSIMPVHRGVVERQSTIRQIAELAGVPKQIYALHRCSGNPAVNSKQLLQPLSSLSRLTIRILTLALTGLGGNQFARRANRATGGHWQRS
jgi:hypothetical protein